MLSSIMRSLQTKKVILKITSQKGQTKKPYETKPRVKIVEDIKHETGTEGTSSSVGYQVNQIKSVLISKISTMQTTTDYPELQLQGCKTGNCKVTFRQH